MLRNRLQSRQTTTSCRSLMGASKTRRTERTSSSSVPVVERGARTKNSLGESSTKTETTTSSSLSPPGRSSSRRAPERVQPQPRQQLPQQQQQQPPPRPSLLHVRGRRAASSSKSLLTNTQPNSRRRNGRRGLHSSSSDLIASMWSSHSELPLNKPHDDDDDEGRQPPPPPRSHPRTGRRGLFTKSHSVPALLLTPKKPPVTTYRGIAAATQHKQHKAASDDDHLVSQKIRHCESSREIHMKQTGRRSRFVTAPCGYYYNSTDPHDHPHPIHHGSRKISIQEQVILEEPAAPQTIDSGDQKPPNGDVVVTRNQKQPHVLVSHPKKNRETAASTTKPSPPRRINMVVVTSSPLDMVIEVPANFDGGAVI